MDLGGGRQMKIMEILPELVEGGVERHVLMLSDRLVRDGHEVMVVSGGGKLVEKLNPQVEHWTLPVQRKNLITGLGCARKISERVKAEGWDILHAHSRVPAWITMWASSMARKPYVVTAHVNFGNKSRWIYRPYRKAAKVICVSNAVRDNMKTCFYENSQVILNGMPEVLSYWEGPQEKDALVRFLFVGRLSKVKGIHELVGIFSDMGGNWVLDIVGDGPLMPDLKKRIDGIGMGERMILHGYRDDTDEWMKRCSCLLFPSYNEGMPLTLARAIQMHVPAIASDIPPVREMALSADGLIAPGEISLWKERIRSFMDTGDTGCSFNPGMIPTIPEMTEQVEDIYAALALPGKFERVAP